MNTLIPKVWLSSSITISRLIPKTQTIFNQKPAQNPSRFSRPLSMDQVSEVQVDEVTESIWIKPKRMKFTHNGVQKTWDFAVGLPSVFIVAYNTDSQKLVMVRQIRPTLLHAALVKASKDGGQTLGDVHDVKVAEEAISLEFCAGIKDKPNKSLVETAKCEMIEECGYEVSIDKLEEIQTFPSSVGTKDEAITMFFTLVTNEMRKGDGGGLADEGEMIEVVELSIDEVKTHLKQAYPKSPPWTLYGLMWFMYEKFPTLN